MGGAVAFSPNVDVNKLALVLEPFEFLEVDGCAIVLEDVEDRLEVIFVPCSCTIRCSPSSPASKSQSWGSSPVSLQDADPTYAAITDAAKLNPLRPVSFATAWKIAFMLFSAFNTALRMRLTRAYFSCTNSFCDRGDREVMHSLYRHPDLRVEIEVYYHGEVRVGVVRHGGHRWRESS